MSPEKNGGKTTIRKVSEWCTLVGGLWVVWKVVAVLGGAAQAATNAPMRAALADSVTVLRREIRELSGTVEGIKGDVWVIGQGLTYLPGPPEYRAIMSQFRSAPPRARRERRQ